MPKAGVGDVVDQASDIPRSIKIAAICDAKPPIDALEVGGNRGAGCDGLDRSTALELIHDVMRGDVLVHLLDGECGHRDGVIRRRDETGFASFSVRAEDTFLRERLAACDGSRLHPPTIPRCVLIEMRQVIVDIARLDTALHHLSVRMI